MAETFDDHDDVMELDHDDKERSKLRPGMKLVAAGFVATVVVVAAILFIVNRNGDSGNSSTADNSASGDDLVSEMEWTGKRADINGQMVYFPKDTKGQPFSTTVRDYSGDPGAAGSGTPSRTVFQTTDFSGGAPVPFSTQDGPTGFDGTVPVGYSQSAAGAALAAAAYFPQISPVRTTYEEFVEKATYRPTSDQLSRAAERVADDKDSRAPGEHGTIVGAAASMYSVPVFDTDYARVILYIPQKEGNT
ncbi:MAG: hypothetical protein ACTH8X_12095, partial [Corynebacterium variabile]